MQGIFNIIGPAMIGPSSSHTAGAEKLGRVIFILTDGDVEKVVFRMHGSFAATSKGHGTELALLAGVMGLSVVDEMIKDAVNIAKIKGLAYEFTAEDLGDAEHPNTVVIEAIGKSGHKTTIKGSSVGGGNIIISAINGAECHFSGDYPAIVVCHLDKVGMISKITAVFEKCESNIVTLKNGRLTKGREALTMIETDMQVSQEVVNQLRKIPFVLDVQTLSKLS